MSEQIKEEIIEEKLKPISKINKRDQEKQARIAVKLLEKLDYEVVPNGFLKCGNCGKIKSIKEKNFYNSQSRINTAHGKIPVCKTCIEGYYNEYLVNNAGDVKKSLFLLAQELNCVFKQTLVDMAIMLKEKRNIMEYKTFIGKANSMGQYTGLNFSDSDPYDMTTSQVIAEEKRQEESISFTTSDFKNRDTIFEIVGKDPFEGMSIPDRKVLYSDFIEYLTEENSENKFLLSQIQLVVMYNHTNSKMNMALSAISGDIAQLTANSATIKELISNMQKLSTTTTTIAKENGIARKNNDAKKNSTITGMMVKYRDFNIDDIEPSFYDQVGGVGMQRVANISTRAMFDQGLFGDQEFSEMLQHSREMLITETKIRMELEEKIRKLKLELFELKNGGEADVFAIMKAKEADEERIAKIESGEIEDSEENDGETNG